MRDLPPLWPEQTARDQPLGAITWSWNVATGDVTWADGIDEALFGLPPGTFGGTFEAYLALVHPDDRAYFQAVIARTLAGTDEYVMSHRVVWPDGSEHWIDGRGRLTRDDQGRPLLLSGVAWTAEARTLAEARLRHLQRVQAVASAVSRELLRVRSDEEVFEAACRIAVEHGHFRFAWIGAHLPGAARFLPLARAGAENGYLDLIYPTIDLTAGTAITTAVHEGRTVIVNDVANDEIFRTWKDAALQRGFRAVSVLPLRRAGRVMGQFAIYADVEQSFDADQVELLEGLAADIGFKLDALDADARRRTAEEEMRHSEERYHALVEQAADAIFLADADDTLLELNTSACAMIGYARDEIVGQKLAVFLAPRRGEPRLAHHNPPGSRVSGERRMRRKDGVLIDVELTVTTLADRRMQGYARDVTKRNELQQQLLLSDRLASLGRLAAGVAHEINNPLAYVTLNLERIARAVASGAPSSAELADIAAAAADARDGTNRVRAVTRSLSVLSRDDEGAARTVDVHHVLDGAARLAENNLRHRGRIVKSYGATRSVAGNELRLGQVFVNLLVNASDALRDDTPAENEILVRTFDEGDRVVIEVRDNGVGIAPEIGGRIFDPFFTTKPVGEGTGLGLSISHGIVSTYGGSITVESGSDGGATFRVSLMADGPLAAEPSSGVMQRRLAKASRILVVDDEIRLAQSLAVLLSHHEVTLAATGTEALTLCRARPFDVILCDLLMPGLSGIDLHAELVRDGHGLDGRMIFMTGGASTPRAREFVAQQPNEVLEKPFAASRLETAIAGMLERVSAQQLG